MSNQPQPVVTESSYLTLHYRITSMAGEDIISTFQDTPATLQLGHNQLAPSLEAILLGLPEGTHQTFELTPEQAFGPRNQDLVRRVSLATLQENSAPGHAYKLGDLVEFSAPGGGRFAGVLLEFGDTDALFDFNHPLAGQPVKFEVKLIGVL